MRRDNSRHRGFLFALMTVVLAVPCAGIASTIGLYTDASGSSCSFAGNDPGIVTAYVIINPDGSGVRSAQFAAVIPPCLGATHLYDEVPAGVTSVGSSPSGISLSYPFCASEPALAVTINYYRTGSTTPCCEFPVVAAPPAGTVEGVDCSFSAAIMVPLTSHFNADASCPCYFNLPPPPSSPNPPHNAAAVSVFTGLSWLPAQSEYDIASYDVYLGTNPTPPFVANVAQAAYQPAQLQELTQHYWRIVLHADSGIEIPGPTWTFTTRATNSPPGVPSYLAPVNGATNVLLMNTVLQWGASTDVDGDPVEYDVYFGTAADPPLVATDLTVLQYALPTLEFSTTYSWRVLARDSEGHETSGPIATFTTRPLNFPPNAPSNPSPAHNATFQPLGLMLSWSGSDPDPGDILSYDLYFGTSTTPPLVLENTPGTSYGIITLLDGVNYYWKVVVRDNHGAETGGPLWTFRTNAMPVVTNLSPADGAEGLPLAPTVTWQGSDADGEVLTYLVHWGYTTALGSWEATGTTQEYTFAGHSYSQTVWWRVQAYDNHGASRNGPMWSFTTVTNTAPTQASNPVPPDNGYSGTGILIEWDEATDPESPVTYLVSFGNTNPPPFLAMTFETQYEVGPFDQGAQYFWRIDVSDGTDVTTGELWTFTGGSQPPTGVGPAPKVLTLGRNHPNPFNPQTIIPYGVPDAAGPVRVRLAVYDSAGRLVRVLLDEHQAGGTRDVVWRGDDAAGRMVSSGVYFCVLESAGERRTQKLVLLK